MATTPQLQTQTQPQPKLQWPTCLYSYNSSLWCAETGTDSLVNIMGMDKCSHGTRVDLNDKLQTQMQNYHKRKFNLRDIACWHEEYRLPNDSTGAPITAVTAYDTIGKKCYRANWRDGLDYFGCDGIAREVPCPDWSQTCFACPIDGSCSGTSCNPTA